MGCYEIINKNDMALCTVGWTTFQIFLKNEQRAQQVENVTICVKTKEKRCICKYLRMHWVSLKGTARNCFRIWSLGRELSGWVSDMGRRLTFHWLPFLNIVWYVCILITFLINLKVKMNTWRYSISVITLSQRIYRNIQQIYEKMFAITNY